MYLRKIRSKGKKRTHLAFYRIRVKFSKRSCSDCLWRVNFSKRSLFQKEKISISTSSRPFSSDNCFWNPWIYFKNIITDNKCPIILNFMIIDIYNVHDKRIKPKGRTSRIWIDVLYLSYHLNNLHSLSLSFSLPIYICIYISSSSLSSWQNKIYATSCHGNQTWWHELA